MTSSRTTRDIEMVPLVSTNTNLDETVKSGIKSILHQGMANLSKPVLLPRFQAARPFFAVAPPVAPRCFAVAPLKNIKTPRDHWVMIYTFLDLASLTNTMNTCKKLSEVANTNTILKRLNEQKLLEGIRNIGKNIEWETELGRIKAEASLRFNSVPEKIYAVPQNIFHYRVTPVHNPGADGFQMRYRR